MQGFNGIEMGLGNLARLSGARTRSISAENPGGGKGQGGMALEGTGKHASRDLGRGWKVSPSVDVPGNCTSILAEITEPGVIQHIWMTCYPDNWRTLILRMYWDGEDAPSVEVPFGDFFCNGWCERSLVNSLPVSVNPAGGMNSYWSMPFRQSAKITIENISEHDATLFYQIDYALTDVPDDQAYFHAQWRRSNPLPYKDVHTIVDGIAGKGHYVGTYLAWQVNNCGWFGEGEIKFYLDHDDEFPTCWSRRSWTLSPSACAVRTTTRSRWTSWRQNLDDAFLAELWPFVKKSLQFAADHWDPDGDLLLEGKQHNTYDIEFYGVNPLTGVMYLGALKAASELAVYLGEKAYADRLAGMFEESSRKLDALLWNGSYYVQRLDDVNAHKYQFGAGCLSDQLLGQQLAHLYGIGYLLPKERVAESLLALYKNNFRSDFHAHTNCQRTYVLNDERGLVLCSWPEGGRPRLPFVYSDEVWTGIEYQVAVHLIYEGFVQEGLTLVRAVWERHDGVRRNPWNEGECGHHYARALASWGLLNALSGYQFDVANRKISFAPVADVLIGDRFSVFWSTGRAWGSYSQTKDAQGSWQPELKVLYGDASGITVQACGREWMV